MGRKKIPLPPKCFAVLPGNGRLVTIHYREPGYLPSSLETGDRAKNRTIADKKNQELGGVMPEQEKAMVDGAVIGWVVEAAVADMRSDCTFEVRLSKKDSPYTRPMAILRLPATQYELVDALEKIRVWTVADPCTLEILRCSEDYLPQLIPTDANLLELNYLAERLEAMEQWEADCFSGLVMMNATRNEHASIPIGQLINMTHSLSDCQIAYGVHDDAALGKFYVDNDFPVVPDNLPAEIYEKLDYSVIGKEARESECGIFIAQGYVVHSGELVQGYQRRDAVLCSPTDYMILLRLFKGSFNDSVCDSDLAALLKLPCSENDFNQALDAVGVASLAECGIEVIDCIVPSLKPALADELDDCEGDITVVYSFAKQLQQMVEGKTLPVYKAMLDALPDEILLDDAIELGGHVVDFQLDCDMLTPSDYAHRILSPHMEADMLKDMEDHVSLDRYGRVVMARDKATETGYGILHSRCGQAVEQLLDANGPTMEMG